MNKAEGGSFRQGGNFRRRGTMIVKRSSIAKLDLKRISSRNLSSQGSDRKEKDEENQGRTSEPQSPVVQFPN